MNIPYDPGMPVAYTIPDRSEVYVNTNSPDFVAGVAHGQKLYTQNAAEDWKDNLDRRRTNIEELVQIMRELTEEDSRFFLAMSRSLYSFAENTDMPPRLAAASILAVVAGLAVAEVGDVHNGEGFEAFEGFAADALAVAVVNMRTQRGWAA